jgi:hypothetical protein
MTNLTAGELRLLSKNFERLVDKYVQLNPAPTEPNRRERFKTAVEYAQPITIVIAVLAFIFTLPPVAAWLERLAPNSDLKPLARTRYENPTASSYLDNSKDREANITYSPANLLDDDPSTGWSECAGGSPVASNNVSRADATTCASATSPSLEGSGEWFMLTLTQSTDIKAIRIRNGFQRSYTLYRVNPRVRSIDVLVSGVSGNQIASFPAKLEDDFGLGYQYINLGSNEILENVKTVRFTIRDVWPAESVKRVIYQDVTVSDIQLIPSHLSGTA